MSTHPISRPMLRSALAVALLAGVALAGCKKQPEPSTNPTAGPSATAPAPAAAPQPMLVTTVDLGNAIDADNRIDAPMSTFSPGDTIHASVGTDGGSAGTLTAKWTYQDGQVVDSTDKSVAAGPQVTEFSIAKPDGWPTGQYHLEIQLDGKAVQSRDFEVR